MNKRSSFKLTTRYIKEYPSDIKDFRNQLLPGINYITGMTYAQVFEDKHGFIDNCSILDLLMCTGPEAAILFQSND
jgi:hypothetical protein